MKLRSIDYAEIIRKFAFGRFGVSLGKTQVIKLLYILYGLYLARKDTPLFDDDRFFAWPYGPVVPKVYEYLSNTSSCPLSQEVMEEISNPENKDAMELIFEVVSKRYFWSATSLTNWSHQNGSPWFKTVYGENGDRAATWGNEIQQEDIKSYFRTFSL